MITGISELTESLLDYLYKCNAQILGRLHDFYAIGDHTVYQQNSDDFY